MKRNRTLIIFLVFIMFLFMPTIVKADDYSIENIDMQVEIKENGDLKIEEKLIYNFNGKYNGIYITIPYGLNDSKYDKIRKQNALINDSFYNASTYNINEISVDGKSYDRAYNATNGMSNVYTVESRTDTQSVDKIKIYSPSSYTTKTFNVVYTLKNVAVKHNDIGEIYYNFIGGNWDKTIKKLNIDISLPNNTSKENLYAFAHGPNYGVVTIKDKNNINLYIENVPTNNYVAGRILFDLKNIPNSTKKSNKSALSLIMQEEKDIYNKMNEKYRFKNITLGISIGLCIYWVILILAFEKDERYNIASCDDEMFEKYNPLIAGCLQGNRNALPRDIIAVILELVNKKYLNLRIEKNTSENKNKEYKYYLCINQQSTYEPDKIEKLILDWIHLKKNLNAESSSKKQEIELINELEELPKRKTSSSVFEEIDNRAMKYLNNMGANKSSVPTFLKIFNNIIFVIGIILGIVNIINSTNSNFEFSSVITEIIPYLIILGICAFIIFIKIYFRIKRFINKAVQEINGQKITITSITIILILTFIMVITAIINNNQFILAAELIIGISTLIILTDDLMMKNDQEAVVDYSKLNALKSKIENYSMMQEKDIKEVVLWEKYLTYAIAFGLASKVSKYIEPMLENKELSSLIDDRIMYNFIENDYSYFILRVEEPSERRISEIMENNGGSNGSSKGSFSAGRRRKFFWRWRVLWWRRKRPEAEELFKNRCEE